MKQSKQIPEVAELVYAASQAIGFLIGMSEKLDADIELVEQEMLNVANFAISQSQQEAVKQISNDLEIVYTQVGDGIDVPMLGSKKMSRFIDSQTALREYFESLQSQSIGDIPTEVPKDGEIEKVKKNIGQLRQYLNERTSKEPVTNKEIEVMLGLEE